MWIMKGDAIYDRAGNTIVARQSTPGDPRHFGLKEFTKDQRHSIMAYRLIHMACEGRSNSLGVRIDANRIYADFCRDEMTDAQWDNCWGEEILDSLERMISEYERREFPELVEVA